MIQSTLTGEWGGSSRPRPRPSCVSSSGGEDTGPFHVAIIMDGNGRWAELRGRPRSAGHVAGTSAVRRTVETAPELGVTTLTLYAFSADNWRRPPAEVDHLMGLFDKYLRSECARLAESGVRLSVIGRRDRLPSRLRASIGRVEHDTANGTKLHLRLAIDYSGRDALVEASARLGHAAPNRVTFEQSLARAIHAPQGTPDVDLLIRTGGERRLSDFLLWESAYAELFFTYVLWPDFCEADLAFAVADFSSRERRYGALTTARPNEDPVLHERRVAQ